MKKLMILAAVAALGFAAEAASTKWAGMNFYVPVATAEGPMTASSGDKFAAGSTAVAFQLFIVDHANGDALVELTDASFAFSGVGLMAAKELWNQDKSVEMRDAYGSSGIVDLVLKGVYSDAGYDYVYTGTAQADLKNITSQAKTFTFQGNKANAWTATATPEPTSGLLLLLGVAGLALRRRRA